MEQKLKILLTALLVANANQKWILPNPITIRMSSNDFDVLEIQGLQVTEKQELYVMEFEDQYGYEGEVWRKLENDHEGFEIIIDKIHERVIRVYKMEEAK